MQALFADPIVLAIVAVGALGCLALAVLVVRRHGRLAADTARLLYLALDGRPEEARVEARASARRFAPVLSALSGDLAPPKPRRPASDLLAVVLLFAPPAALIGYVLWAAQNGDFAARAHAVGGGLLGLGLLLPLSTIAAAVVIAAARRSARSVRGSCLTVLAKSARVAVDADVADALRQGGLKDPRNA